MKKLLAGFLSLVMTATVVATPLRESLSNKVVNTSISVKATSSSDVKTAYKNILYDKLIYGPYNYDYPYDYQLDYTVYDMDKNGIPELIINEGTCEASKTISIYTYSSGKAKLLKKGLSGFHVYGFEYDNKNKKLVTLCGHMGYGRIEWFTLSNGKITSTYKNFEYNYDDFDKILKKYGTFKTLPSIHYNDFYNFDYCYYTNSNGNSSKVSFSRFYSIVDNLKVTNKKPAIATVSGFKTASNKTNLIKLKWNKVSGAKGYIVYKYNSSKKTWTRVSKTTATSYTVKKLKAGTTYKFAVKAYKTSGKKEITSSKFPQVTTSTMPAKVSFRLSSSTNKATVKWLKVNGASGYKVYYKTSKSGKWTLLKICSNKTISYTKTGLTKGKTYWFTVKAYRKVGKLIYNGKYTTKKVLTKLSSKNIPKATISKATLNLSLVDNSTYQLKVSTYLQGTVRWHSSNNSVVKVDSKGNVKAIGSGTAEITASINNYKMKCKVSVSDKSYKTITINPISLEDWKKKIDKVESSMIGYPSYFNLSNGQKINTSRIILNRKILEYKTLTDRIPEFVQGPNAQVRYKTIKVKVPIKIKYTLHKHSLNNDSSAEAVGKFLYGAVNQNVVVLQQKCSCGLKCELSWQMPLEEFNTVATGNTYIVSTTSANK